MLRVTVEAKEKLEGTLQESTKDPEVAVRVFASPSKPRKYGFTFDKEKEGDQVVKSKEGLKVLLIQSDLAHELEGMVLDYQVTPQGEGFTILKIASDN